MRVSSDCDGNINYSQNNNAFGEPVNQSVPAPDNPVQHGVEPLVLVYDDQSTSSPAIRPQDVFTCDAGGLILNVMASCLTPAPVSASATIEAALFSKQSTAVTNIHTAKLCTRIPSG